MSRTRRTLAPAAAALLIGSGFLIDIDPGLRPLGLSAAPYVAAIWACCWSPQSGAVPLASLLCAAAALSSVAVLPPEQLAWPEIASRCSVLAAICLTGFGSSRLLAAARDHRLRADEASRTAEERARHQRDAERLRRATTNIFEDLALEREERLRQAAEVQQGFDRLDLALRAANLGLWDWDATTNDVYFSTTAKTQLGYPPDDTWGGFDDWKSRLHPEDVSTAVRTVDDYFQHRTDEYVSEFRMRRADGTYSWILSQGQAEFDAEGRATRLIGVHVDITRQVEHERALLDLNARLETQADELKRRGDQLERANDALQHSNEELQRFAYVASHDLQTPLRAIASFAQLLDAEHGAGLEPEARDYLDRIVAGVARMQQLINDLLAFSRVGSRAAPFTEVDLNEVFDDTLSLMAGAVRDTGAAITRDDLPRLFADRSQLSQLMQNLIGNAIKYHGECPPEVHVSARRCDGGWTVGVSDNGIGIAPRHQERIFEVFQRLHTERTFPGTGIGLAICRRIVTRHKGRIWVESEEGRGSRFCVWFPALNETKG